MWVGQAPSLNTCQHWHGRGVLAVQGGGLFPEAPFPLPLLRTSCTHALSKGIQEKNRNTKTHYSATARQENPRNTKIQYCATAQTGQPLQYENTVLCYSPPGRPLCYTPALQPTRQIPHMRYHRSMIGPATAWPPVPTAKAWHTYHHSRIGPAGLAGYYYQ